MHSSTKISTVLALIFCLGMGHAVAESAKEVNDKLSLIPVEREPAEGREVASKAEIESLRDAVQAEPKNRQAHFNLVKGLMRAKDLEAALKAAKAWREMDAYNLVVVRLLGDIYSEMGDSEKALRAYSAVVELLPKDHKAQRALASVLKQSGNIEAAYQRLAAAATLRPDDVRIGFELADSAHRLGRTDEARARFEAIAGSEEASMAIRYPSKQRLAQIYAELRRNAVAEQKTDAAAELDAAIKTLDITGGVQNDIKIFLTWDTDRSDVDLWVVNPAREKVYYSHKKGRYGGSLYNDVTTGYGPESFTAHKAHKGTYLVQVNFFDAGRSNFPEARGEVTVVLDEGTAREKKHVLPYRLFEKSQTVTVARIEVR